MPRIRKQTSKRSTTHERRKLINKVRESKKKTRKAAKKSTQWKSKHKKDPGIPSNFPYKDQLLAEVAEQRRLAEENKQKRKEEKRAAKTGVAQEEEELDKNLEGVASLAAKHLVTAQATSSKPTQVIEDESDEDEAPLLVSPDLPDLEAVLQCADVIVNMLDARDPLPCRSEYIEEWIRGQSGKRLLFVLNKIDTCPREAVSAWATHLRSQNHTFLFRSASAFLPDATQPSQKSKGKSAAKQASDAIGRDAIIACLQKWSKEKGSEQKFTIAVVGPTNSGKSSFINSLLRSRTFPIYDLATSTASPSTTMQAHEASLDLEHISLRILDTPGLMWKQGESIKDAGNRTRDILLRNKGRIDRLKDPLPVVEHILGRAAPEDLMLFYNLPAFSKGDITSFLSGLARTKQLVMKHGKLDLTGASRIVLRDWSIGKFPRYTIPPTTQDHSNNAGDSELYTADADILKALPSRKEMRKEHGIVKLAPCEVETREAVMNEPWLNIDDDESDSDDAMEGDGEEGVDSDMVHEANEDENEEETHDGSQDEDAETSGDESSEEVEDPPLRPALVSKIKRKRAPGASTAQPNKRVAFANGGKRKTPYPSQPSIAPISRPSPKGLPKKVARKARSKA